MVVRQKAFGSPQFWWRSVLKAHFLSDKSEKAVASHGKKKKTGSPHFVCENFISCKKNISCLYIFCTVNMNLQILETFTRLKALVCDHPLLFIILVAYESPFSSSSSDYFFEFPGWSFTRALTVAFLFSSLQGYWSFVSSKSDLTERGK